MKKTIIAAILAATAAGSAFAGFPVSEKSCSSVAEAIFDSAPGVFEKDGIEGLSAIQGAYCRDYGKVEVTLVNAKTMQLQIRNVDIGKILFISSGLASEIAQIKPGEKKLVTEMAEYDEAKTEMKHVARIARFDDVVFVVTGDTLKRKQGEITWANLSEKKSKAQNALAKHNKAFSASESEALKTEAGFKASQAHGQAGLRSTEHSLQMMQQAIQTASQGSNIGEIARNAIADAVQLSASNGAGIDAGRAGAHAEVALLHSKLSASEKRQAGNVAFKAALSLSSQGFEGEVVRSDDFQLAQSEYIKAMGDAIGGYYGSGFIESAKAVQHAGFEVGKLNQIN
ncbi:MAG: hypothetical protein HGA71_08430 [Azonexaceae bacterium]|nr:hypothetical protein [Azonexaceae bacterium]